MFRLQQTGFVELCTGFLVFGYFILFVVFPLVSWSGLALGNVKEYLPDHQTLVLFLFSSMRRGIRSTICYRLREICTRLLLILQLM